MEGHLRKKIEKHFMLPTISALMRKKMPIRNNGN